MAELSVRARKETEMLKLVREKMQSMGRMAVFVGTAMAITLLLAAVLDIGSRGVFF